ncbi:FAD-binding domain-containing protein [Hypoxylon rubiginosum]|uniref:FAD-binding domain-containing protein n=1 Tax=Hypoxylon rubiginosum TaxID=110542 RepID=A0ACC0CW11_9PEZI|nr:FAD-binding domain-containing protein [Hypoxylon rubiginosum]
MWSIYVAYLTVLPFATAGVTAVNAIRSRDYAPSFSQEGSCQQACETFASEYPGRLHYEDVDTNFTIWDQKQLQTVYVCRVEPESASEVSNIVQVLVDNWCRFAVKCGGHSRYPDDSVSVGGVTIDLGLINSTVVSDDRTTAIVGGGALTRQVFAALDPYGLAYVGGRVGQVGMGGFTLGGGTSVLAAKYGWALDSVLEYEIVLPNATIATVSETQHPDLYYALRGGGNNFGIVTSFNVTVFPQGQVYTGSRTFGDDQTDRFLEEAEKVFTIEDAEDTNVVLEYRYAYSAAQDRYTMSSTQRYAEPVSNPPAFDAMNAIPALNNLSGGITSLAASTSFSGPLGRTRNIFASLTHYPSVELGKRAILIFKDNVLSLGNVTGVNPELITYSIPAAAIENMRARGGNALGIDVQGHLVINLLSVSWSNSTNDGAAYSFADRFIEDFRRAAERLDVLHPFIYINYANKGQDVFSGYGEENKKKLIAIQESIDPRGVFTSSGLWPGFFKVR